MKNKTIMLSICCAALAVPFAYGLVSRSVIADSKESSDSDTQAAVTIDADHFPDAAFRECVKSFDLNNNGSLSTEEIEEAYDLYCSELGIKSLKGVEYFTNAGYLDCSDNELTELDISKLQNLQTLYCGGNKIQKLDLSKNSNLEYLDCYNNWEYREGKVVSYGSLTSINVSKCPNLSTLIVDGNKLTKLDLSNNPEIYRLRCESNKLSSLDVSHLSNLVELEVSFNQLTKLDVSNSSRLTTLYCSHNPITTLDISSNKDLEYLNCEANKISSLDLSAHYSLTTIQTHGNKLSELDISETRIADVFDPALAEETTDVENGVPYSYYYFYYTDGASEDPLVYVLSYNTSTKLTCEKKNQIVCQIDAKNFPDDLFREYVTQFDLDKDKALSVSEIAQVKLIDLRREEDDLAAASLKGIEFFTNLSTLSLECQNIEELCLGDMPNLFTVDVSNTFDERTGELLSKLVKVDLSGCPNLFSFNSSNNPIKSIDVSKNQKLEYLTLYAADISSLDVSMNTKLDLLSVSYCANLKSLDISKCTKLEYLDFRGTGISSINLSKNPDLHTIDCYAAALRTLDLSKNTKLRELHCGMNRITTLDLRNNPYLETLECSFSQDSCLKNLDISKNTNLKELNVAGNSLTKMDVSNCPDLTVLNLYYNKITDLNVSKNTKLEVLNILQNKIPSLDVSHCPNLRELDISANPITKIDISKNKKLDYFSCMATDVSKVDLKNVNLRYLNLAMSEVKDVDLSGQTNLEQLYLVSMGLEKLDLTKNTKLRWVEVEDNLLSELDLTKMKNLEYLDIRFNMFTAVPKNNCAGEVIVEPQKTVEAPKNLHLEGRTEIEIDLAWEEGEGLAKANVYDIYRSESKNGEFARVGRTANTSFTDGNTVDGKRYYYYVSAVRDLNEYGLGEFTKDSEVLEIKGNGEDPSDDATFEDFVERLYTVALGRASEPEGKEFWIKQVVEEGKSGADCARFFLLDAPEFMNRNLSTEDFVETLYKTFFDRESDAEGKKGWVDAISSGAKTRAEVVNDFIESTEWCDVCATYGVKSGAIYHKATKASKNAINFATRLYTCCLKRDAEDGGLKYWSLALTNLEKTGAEAALFFFESDEFKGFNTTDKEYLTRLYTTFMDREPAQSEVDYWLGEIAGGRQNRHSILAFFAQSEEFTGICKKYGIDRGTI